MRADRLARRPVLPRRSWKFCAIITVFRRATRRAATGNSDAGRRCGPGPSLHPFEYDQLRTVHIEALVEYPDSEAAKAWTDHFAYGRAVRHDAIYFLSANTRLTVFASDVVLLDME
ncbi:hypothetical protein [Massilia genomosp. 1]|uniref:EthD domain-containing protein n=1 Tax=Massilia genomosp. 1 TaxID=2609280 RepID=A0ABX0MUQ5_9BURK|nr:hypothetical protein [Massilia genomosp. 1]NHZ61584.1 hypothetical protein [Massilia genomosp. 1]